MNKRQDIYQEIMTTYFQNKIEHFYDYCLDQNIALIPLEKEHKNSKIFELPLPNYLHSIVAKKIPMIQDDFMILSEQNAISLQDLIYSEQHSIWREIYIQKLCNQVLLQQISPHFPFFYCHCFSFDNLNINNYEGPFIFLLNEKMDMDAKTWVMEKERTTKEWMDFFCQLFFAIYTIQRTMSLFHNDMHWGNILIKKLSSPQSWTYQIMKNTFVTLEHQTFLLSICDFGLAKFDSSIFSGNENSLKDFKRTTLNIHLWSKKYKPCPNIQFFLSRIKHSNAKNMKELFRSVIYSYVSKQKTNPFYNLYSQNISLQINEL